MFLEAFCSSHGHGNAWTTSSPLLIHRRFAQPNILLETTASETPVALSDSIEERQRHVVTVPPFEEEEDTHPYPSLLHHIHVVPFLEDDETTTLLALAQEYARENNSWDQQDSSRHVSYPTVDFAIEDSSEISQYLGKSAIRFEERIFDALSEAYDVDAEDLSFLDLFCTSYEAENVDDGSDVRNTMDRLDLHRDGSLLSFTILLSPLEAFEGGGTVFDALGDMTIDDYSNSTLQPHGVIQPPQSGYATLHSGKLLHGGHAVTKGQRIVLVGFVDVHERNIKPGAIGKATKGWGRNDVRTYWNRRRLAKQQQQQKPVNTEGDRNDQPRWELKNWRYLPKDTAERRSNAGQGRSHFGKTSLLPKIVLNRIEHRASVEKIRRRRLRTEDRLLRQMLLPRDERGEKIAEDEGTLTEVDLDNMDGVMWDGMGMLSDNTS